MYVQCIIQRQLIFPSIEIEKHCFSLGNNIMIFSLYYFSHHSHHKTADLILKVGRQKLYSPLYIWT